MIIIFLQFPTFFNNNLITHTLIVLAMMYITNYYGKNLSHQTKYKMRCLHESNA